MGRSIAAVTLLALSFYTARMSAAQSVDVTFMHGRVWLVATDAQVPEILREWARQSGTAIVNGDGLVGAPLTLELRGVPERDALATILRDTAGYIAASRPVGSAGASTFDRILILPTTSVPAAPARTASARETDAPRRRDDLPEPLMSILRAAGAVSQSEPSSSPR